MSLKDEGLRSFGFWELRAFVIRNGTTSKYPVEQIYSWYESEDFIKQLKDNGINLYITNFSKGFGIETERDNWKYTRSIVELCHKYGLYAGGYIRYSTLIPDTMSVELPDCIEKFSDRTLNGGHARYNTQYWRYMPCPTSKEYLEYLDRLIMHGLKEIGLDLLHVDGVVLRHEPDTCRCQRCQERFKEWLLNRYPTPEAREKRLGYANFNHLELPNYTAGIDFASPLPILNDPLAQEWMLFRTDLLAEIWKFIVDSAHKHNPKCLVQCNTSFYPTSNGMWFSGLDIIKLSSAGNYGFFSEEEAPDFSSDRRIVGYFETCKKLRGLGHTVFAYNRENHGAEEKKYSPDTEKIKRLMAAHMAFNNDSVGQFMAKREPGYVPSTPKNYMDFHEKNRNLFYQAEQAHEIAIYYSQRTYALNCGKPTAVKDITFNTLLRGHIPFGFLFSEKRSDINMYKAIILPETECLPESEAEDIASYVRNGGGIVIIGETTGCYDEFRRPYGKNILLEKLSITAAENVSHYTIQCGKGRVAYIRDLHPFKGDISELVKESIKKTMPFPYVTSSEWNILKNSHDLLRLTSWAAGGLQYEFTLPDTVLIEFSKQASTGHTLLHFVNFDMDNKVSDFEIRYRQKHVKNVVCHTPDEESPHIKLCRENDESGVISLNGFHRYLIVELF